MLYWLYIEYEEDGITKTLEKFFASENERKDFVKEFRKGRK